jgi:aspartate aminotransferase-like enzyme
MNTEYKFEVSATDTSVAFDCEAERAEREGFKGVAERQRANALHLRNAVHHMQGLCPEGFRVETRIVVALVPHVNPVLRDEIREGRG